MLRSTHLPPLPCRLSPLTTAGQGRKPVQESRKSRITGPVQRRRGLSCWPDGAGSVSGRRSALHAEGVEAAEVLCAGLLMEPHGEVDVAARGEGVGLAHAARLLAGGLREAHD